MSVRLFNSARRFLRWYCSPEQVDEVEGDLLELYELRSKKSVKRAAWHFLWDVIRSFRWSNIKKPRAFQNPSSMWKNYLVIGYRNLIKDYQFSIINLLGLSLGLSIFLTIVLMVRHELTFDRFHEKGDRIFHVTQEFQSTEGSDPEIFTALPLADALKESMPMVSNALTLHSAASTWMEINGERFFEEDGIVSSPAFFDFFDFPLIKGDASSALTNARSIVINEQLAAKLFDNMNPMGQVIDIERYGLFTVSGVLKDVPTNSFIQFDFILTQDYEVFFEYVHPRFPGWFQSWEGDPAATFVMLHNPADATNFEHEVGKVLENHLEADLINPHRLINLYDLHFGLSGIDGSINEYLRGDTNQLNLLMIIAALILLMACFNFINLVTARSILRSKEVGVRKSMGAISGQIFTQFMTEAFLQVTISSLLAVGWVFLISPYLAHLTGIDISLDGSVLIDFVPYALGILLAVTLLSGIYPAVVLSRYKVTKALKVSQPNGKGSWSLRNLLVVVQYSLVILMVSSLVIVNRQFQYMNDKPLGFETDELLIVEVNGGGVRSGFQELKNDLLTNPNISAVSGLTRMIAGYRQGVGVYAEDVDDMDRSMTAQFYGMDADGLSALGMELVAGQDFQGIKGLDSASVLINETAAAWYGGDKIVGQWISITGEEEEDFLRARVIGIIKDFHYSSLHEPIGPVILGYLSNPFQGLDDLAIRINTTDMTSTLAYIEEIHNRYDENGVMTWEFLDDMVQRAYAREMITRDIFMGASCIAFFISMIGIVGLISFSVMSKTKELGIRKILGASYRDLLTNQGRPFIYFLMLAVTFAAPLTWWLGGLWLEDFAYRVDVGVLPFVLSFALILITTFITMWGINHGSIKRNPIQALRYE